MIALESFVHSLPRLASTAALRCLIFAQGEWPAMRTGSQRSEVGNISAVFSWRVPWPERGASLRHHVFSAEARASIGKLPSPATFACPHQAERPAYQAEPTAFRAEQTAYRAEKTACQRL